MKKLFSLLLISAITIVGATAQTLERVQSTHSVYFEWNKWDIASDAQRAELAAVIDELTLQPQAEIAIVGWTDKTGTERANSTISLSRANSAKEYLEANGIDGSRITVSGGGVEESSTDSDKARRADITLSYYVERPEPVVEAAEPEPEPEPQPEPEPIEQPAPATQQPAPALPSAPIASAPNILEQLSIHTNMLYWLAATPNIGAEWRGWQMIGISVSAGYAPLSSNSRKNNLGGFYVTPEGRAYFGPEERWFAGVRFTFAAYNVKLGKTGYQGNLFGGGLTAGYRLPLWDSFELNFTLGGGYGLRNFDSYRRAENGYNVFVDQNVKKWGFMPLNAGVNLVWNIR